MRLSQEAIRRMINGRVGSGGGGGGSFDPSALAGYATQAWTEENYISKTFFNELFIVHKKVTTVVMDGETEISRTVTTNSVFAPNEIPGTTTETDEETGYVTTVTTEIASIESKKGFWTNYFISALGLNSEGGGGGLTLNEPLATINVSGLANHPSSSGQTIVWNGTAWVYGTAGGGTGTVTGVKVGDITYSPVNGIVSIPAYPTSMAWSAITGKPTTLAGYGITDAKIENGVITLGSNTITPLTSSAITDMATKTWVGQQGFALASNVYSKTDADAKFMTIAAFENLFNALNSSDQKVSHPYSSGVASIKAMVGLWTEQYLSALGKNDSGGEIVLNEPLASINDAGLAAHPSSSGQTIVWNGSAWTYGTAGGSGMTYTFATGDANGQFKVTPSSGAAYNVSIKGLAALAYKASLAVSDIPDLSGRYLPLTGGTLTGGLTISHSLGLTIWDTNHVHDMDFFWTTYQVAEGDTRDIFTMYAYESPRYWDMCIGTHPNAIGNKSLYYNSSTMRWGIGTANPTYTLDVVGTAKATTIRATDIYIGGIHITADNNGIHINSAGLYADTYVSALGLNDSQGVVSALSDLVDVNIVNPTNGQVLKYNATTEKWYNGNDEGVTSLAWSQITGKPTTIAGYGITDAKIVNGTITLGSNSITPLTSSAITDMATKTWVGNNYLPLTGGNITGFLSIVGTSHQNFAISSSAETSGVKWTGMQFQHVTGGTATMYGGIRMDEQNGSLIRYDSTYNTYKIWDAGNDGTGSGLDADLLDGQHASYFATAANLTTANGKITTIEGYFDNGVANSAKRLSGTSSYTAWGRTYWSSGVPQNVSGNIDLNKGEDIRLKDGSNYYRIFGVSSSDNTLLIGWELKSITNSNTTLCAGNDLNIGYGSNVGDTTYGKYWSIFRNNGHLTINADDSSDVFLNVGGATKTTRLYLYKPNAANDTNAVYLEYNTNNAGIHLVGGGFYADTYVSALGLSDSGGSAFDETAMWQALGTTITEKQISSAYLTNALAPYALKTDIPSLKSLSWSYGSVTSASGGSYNGSAVTSFVIPKNTSHLTNDSGFITSSALGAYLPLTGGTLSISGIGGFTLKNTASNYPVIRFEGNTGGGLGFIGIGKIGNVIQPFYVTADANGGYTDGVSQWYTIWHSGNDSALLSSFVNSGDNVSLTVGSTTKTLTVGYSTRALRLKNIVMAAGDDYDTLSGYTADRGSFVAVNINSVPSSSMTLSGMDNTYATLLSFGYNNRTIQFMGFGWSDTLKYRHVYTEPGTTSTYVLSPWKTIAFTDGNIASATRLAGTTSKTAWGQTYWSNGQPQDISGNMTSVGNITMSGSLTMGGALTINNSNGIAIWDTARTHDMAMFWNTVTATNRDAFNIYSYEGSYYDVALGVNANYVESLGGLYFNASQLAWGVGTTTPGRRFGSENVGLKLDVAGIARANQLQAYNTAGETLQLNTTATYNCILYRINDALKWSVGADSSNNFYWYTQPGGNKSVMYLTSAGVLNVGSSVKCTDLWIGNIHITYDSTNGGIHVANGGLSANTYVSALGVGQEGGGSQGLDIEAMWTELGTPNSARQIDKTHISNALSDYVTTDTLNGYATQQWVNSQGFAYASSLSNYVSAVSTSSGKLNVTKGGSTTSTDIVALRLGQTTLGDSASLATFTHSTDLIYTAKGGSNTCADKPTGVDSFGLIAMKTAGGYYGQMLMTSAGEVYTRASNSLSGGWRRQLDSLNWSGVVTLSALGGASTVALTEATTRISTLEGYFNTGGVAKKAAVLNTARTINGTNFDGSASITTRSWGTSRTITLADHDSSNTHANNGIDGSENFTLYLPSTIKATLNGNASSATTATTASKLSTVSKTAWGQTYWTSGGVPTDVSGSIEAGNSGGYIGGFDHIDLNTHASLLGYGGYIDFYYEGANSYTSRIIEKESGVLSINAPNVAGLLVGGYNGDYVQIGQIRIVYESSNNALRIENANNGGAANLYAMGGISALGMSGNASGEVAGNLVPSTDGAYELGSTTKGWSNLYLSNADDSTLNIYVDTGDAWYSCDGVHQFENPIKVSGTGYFSGKLSVAGTNSNSDKLYVNGSMRSSGISYASSHNNTSDARLKNIIGYEEVDVETIARAPLIKFTWKDGDSRVHIGTTAQYWLGTELHDVIEQNDYLSMDYATTALAGVISVARKVMTHEERIKALEDENKRLRNEIETLKAA